MTTWPAPVTVWKSSGERLGSGRLLAPTPSSDNAQVGETLRTLITAGEISARVGELGDEIGADLPTRPQGPALRLIGVLSGACFFLADLARGLDRDVSLDFVRVRSYESGKESSEEIKITKDLDDDVKDLDVLLVEDIVDTGLTVHRLTEMLQQRQPRSLRIATLLDKPSRRRYSVKLDYVGFQIPDHFVVGYGLDYAGRYRNRRDICVLET